MHLLLYKIFLYPKEDANINLPYKIRLPKFALMTMKNVVIPQVRNMILVVFLIKVALF